MIVPAVLAAAATSGIVLAAADTPSQSSGFTLDPASIILALTTAAATMYGIWSKRGGKEAKDTATGAVITATGAANQANVNSTLIADLKDDVRRLSTELHDERARGDRLELKLEAAEEKIQHLTVENEEFWKEHRLALAALVAQERTQRGRRSGDQGLKDHNTQDVEER